MAPNTWKLGDSVVHPNTFRILESGRIIQFINIDSFQSAPLIEFEFINPAVPGKYRIVKSAKHPNDVAIYARLSSVFVPVDSANFLELSISGGKMAIVAKGIKMTSINHVWYNISDFLSLNFVEY